LIVKAQMDTIWPLKPKFVYLSVSFYEGFFTTENNLKHANTLHARMV